MNELFIVMIVLGKVSGSIGPLPYTETQCQNQVIEIYNQCTSSAEEALKCGDVEFRCEWLPERPLVGRFPDEALTPEENQEVPPEVAEEEVAPE